jgi:ribonuclease P protein component
MVAKKYRLPVQTVASLKGASRRGRYFCVKIFKTALPYSRASVIVSTKVQPKATQRNALKRLVYREVGKVLSNLTIADYLIIAQSPVYENDVHDGMIKELKNLITSTS